MDLARYDHRHTSDRTAAPFPLFWATVLGTLPSLVYDSMTCESEVETVRHVVAERLAVARTLFMMVLVAGHKMYRQASSRPKAAYQDVGQLGGHYCKINAGESKRVFEGRALGLGRRLMLAVPECRDEGLEDGKEQHRCCTGRVVKSRGRGGSHHKEKQSVPMCGLTLAFLRCSLLGGTLE